MIHSGAFRSSLRHTALPPLANASLTTKLSIRTTAGGILRHTFVRFGSSKDSISPDLLSPSYGLLPRVNVTCGFASKSIQIFLIFNLLFLPLSNFPSHFTSLKLGLCIPLVALGTAQALLLFSTSVKRSEQERRKRQREEREGARTSECV